MNWIKYKDILLGNLLITFCYSCITVPNHILNGGVTSFSMILAGLLGVQTADVVNLVTLLLLGLCYLGLGREYFLGTVFSGLCYLVLFNLFSLTGIAIYLPKVLCVVIAAAGVGTGYYFCLRARATTVGFDVVALILHRRWSGINIAFAMGCINLGIMLFGGLTYGLLAVLYGAGFIGIQSMLLHRFQSKTERK